MSINTISHWPKDDLLKSCMRESRTYSSVRGVEINVYSTHITSQSFFRLVNILACHAEDREYKFRRPRHLSYILSSLIGFFIAHLTI